MMRRSHPELFCAFVLLVLCFAPAKGQDPAPGGIWTEAEWQKARTLSPLPPLPANPTNALADRLDAAKLGHELFFDRQLSPHGFWCASCHKPYWGFTDGLRVANTVEPVKRNAMTVLNAGYYSWLTWDGARDSLWNQAIGPIESPQEMASSRLHVIKEVMQHHGSELGKLVKFPEGWKTLWPHLPDSGKPGDPAYDNLTKKQKHAVNTVFADILKAIAAYERHIVSGSSPFDRFVAGDTQALSIPAQKGFQHFLRLGCDTCHNTPLFSDDEFHNVGLGPAALGDRGRYDGLEALKKNPFRGTGAFADGKPRVRPEAYQRGESLKGAFRTPSLRELRTTGPYGHNGTVVTLEDWLDHYVDVTNGRKTDFIGKLDDALRAIELTAAEKKELVTFLLSLSSDYRSEWTKELH
jgi:cytochrome c peroxidase